MPLTDDVRRARDAERKRVARAKAAAERDARRAQARTVTDASAASTMRDAVEATISAAKWIVDSDAASVAQARALAKQIDELDHAGETVRSISAHRALSRVLADIGATPTARLQHELRSRRMERADGKEVDEDGRQPTGQQGEGAGGVVTPIRPPKRRRSS